MIILTKLKDLVNSRPPKFEVIVQSLTRYFLFGLVHEISIFISTREVFANLTFIVRTDWIDVQSMHLSSTLS